MPVTPQDLIDYLGGTLPPARQAEFDVAVADPGSPVCVALREMQAAVRHRKGFRAEPLSSNEAIAVDTPSFFPAERPERGSVPADALAAGYRQMIRTAVRREWDLLPQRAGSRQEFFAAVIRRLFDSDQLSSEGACVFWPVAAAEFRILIRERAEEAADRVSQWSTAGESTIVGTAAPATAIARDDAWQQLSRTHPQRARVAELRVFAELPMDVIEAVTSLSREAVVSECNAVKYRFAAYGF